MENKKSCLGVRPLWTQKPIMERRVKQAVFDDDGNEAEPEMEWNEPTGESERVQTGWEVWQEDNREFALSAIANKDPYFDMFRYYDVEIGEDGAPTLKRIVEGA